jgi:2-polyprenyl-3-methyl-5-hydroxy-6-metoxy-1,4-benzoquinol methylase
MSAEDFYNTFYINAIKSKAHEKFCRKVYGKNLCQHGMADQKQIKVMLKELCLDSSSNVLDLGCGPGLITLFIQRKTKCKIKGIDISKSAIEYANAHITNRSTKFEICDISKPENIDGQYDALLMIDTHYFIDDFESLIIDYINKLKPNGKLAILSDQGKGNRELDESKTKASETIIGRYLNENGIAYKGIELYKENRKHWDSKRRTLLRLKTRFEKEGNMEIFKNRMDECIGECSIKGGRYLYVITKTNA